ncbi:MAG: transketolase family protein [Rikenellaceae bacterium]|nr:transketolase family protein [Rikenellaceae bacterium]MDE7356128.1 transketolase family protein [Rikenellaceae bacterium]
MKRFEYTQKKDTRSGFGAGLLEVGRRCGDVVAMCADLTGSLKMDAFKKEFPERFFQAGIAEANMISVGSGLAKAGKIPFVGSFAEFVTGRVYDQVRQSVAYTGANVKIAASHAGITLGEDGATHQVMEDLGLMKMLPGMVVINPCDYNQTKAATIAAAYHDGPVYLRFGRPAVPVFTPEDQPFQIGRAVKMISGSDVAIFATGHLVWKAVEACEILEERGISVELVNIHTIKPLDEQAVIESAAKCGCVVTAEEHLANGGLGDSIAQLLARHRPTPMEYVAVDDQFGESGKPDELMTKFHLDVPDVIAAVERVMARK